MRSRRRRCKPVRTRLNWLRPEWTGLSQSGSRKETLEPYLPKLSLLDSEPFPFNFWTSLALLRLMEALSLEKEPLRFSLPL